MGRENQVELDDNNEVEVDEAHDPVNAEAQSIDATNKAAEQGVKKQSPTRRADKRNGMKAEPKPKDTTKAGMMKAAYEAMQDMSYDQLSTLLAVMENGDIDDAVSEQAYTDADFSDDLNALVESEATLSEGFKDKAAVIFEAAIKSKLSEEIDRLEEEYASQLDEQVEAIQTDLVEKVDGYLNYVVENWMEENKLAVQQGLRTEIAEDFMNNLKDLFLESYIEVPESKVDLVDELAETNAQLEEQLNDAIGSAIEANEQVELFMRDAIIAEHARGLARTEVERLASLAENVEFTNAEDFYDKVGALRESYFSETPTVKSMIGEGYDDEEDDNVVITNHRMAAYVNALAKK